MENERYSWQVCMDTAARLVHDQTSLTGSDIGTRSKIALSVEWPGGGWAGIGQRTERNETGTHLRRARNESIKETRNGARSRIKSKTHSVQMSMRRGGIKSMKAS